MSPGGGARDPGVVSPSAYAVITSSAKDGEGGNGDPVGDPDRPVYVLTLRAVAPAGSADEVAEAVMRTAGELGVHCTVRPDDADVL